MSDLYSIKSSLRVSYVDFSRYLMSFNVQLNDWHLIENSFILPSFQWYMYKLTYFRIHLYIHYTRKYWPNFIPPGLKACRNLPVNALNSFGLDLKLVNRNDLISEGTLSARRPKSEIHTTQKYRNSPAALFGGFYQISRRQIRWSDKI